MLKLWTWPKKPKLINFLRCCEFLLALKPHGLNIKGIIRILKISLFLNLLSNGAEFRNNDATCTYQNNDCSVFLFLEGLFPKKEWCFLIYVDIHSKFNTRVPDLPPPSSRCYDTSTPGLNTFPLKIELATKKNKILKLSHSSLKRIDDQYCYHIYVMQQICKFACNLLSTFVIST